MSPIRQDRLAAMAARLEEIAKGPRAGLAERHAITVEALTGAADATAPAAPVIPAVADVAVMSDAERYEAAVLAAQQLAPDALLARLCSTHPGVVLDAARALAALPSYRMPRRTGRA